MSTRTSEFVPVWREIHGEARQVRTALETAAAQGRLAAPPKLSGWLDDGQIVVQARLLEPAPRQPMYRRRLVVVPAAVVGVLGVLLGLGYAAVALVSWITEHLPTIFGGLIVLGLATAGLARLAGGGDSVGHCPGPWHR